MVGDGEERRYKRKKTEITKIKLGSFMITTLMRVKSVNTGLPVSLCPVKT